MISPGLIRILILEDDPAEVIQLKDFLISYGFPQGSFLFASDWHQAETFASKDHISIILLDLNFGETKGIDSFLKLQQMAPAIPVLVMSTIDDVKVAAFTMKKGAQDYLVKGEFNPSMLGKAIQYAVERSIYIRELWHKEEEYKYLFDSNPSPLIVWDKSTLKIIRVNMAAVTFYGYTIQQLLSTSIITLFDQDDFNINKSLFLSELESGNRLYSTRHVKNDKSSCFVDLVMKDIELHGSLCRIMLVNDVTEKHIAMERLVQSEQQLRKLADNYPNGTISIIDRSYHVHFMDGRDYKKKNDKRENVKYTDFLDERNFEKFDSYMQSVFSGKQVVFDIVLNGESYLVSAAGLSNTRGETDKAILVSQNITGNIIAKKEILFQAEILNNVNDALVVKDLSGNIIYCNAGAERLFGFKSEELTGRPLNEFIQDGFPVNNFSIIREKVMSYGTFNFESAVTNRNGQRVFIETKQTLMCNEHGEPAYIVGISHDIANRIKAEQVLKESEANLQAIFQSTSQSFILMDCDTRIIAFNRNASNAVQTFYNRSLKRGDLYRSFSLPGHEEKFEQHLTDVLNWKIVRFEERYDFPDKKEVYLEVTYSPVIKDNQVIAIIICAEDRTEKALFKETILKSEQKYRDLVETSIDIIWTIDESGKLAFVNSAAATILGWEPDMLIGQHYLNFVAPADRDRVSQHISEAFTKSNQYNNYESSIICIDGSEVNVITHAVVNIDPKTGARSLTGTSRDITQRFRAEQELNEKNRQLRMLSSYLQTIREDERTHIAREIHDELGQQLTGLKMDLAWLNRKLGADKSEYKTKLTEMMKLVDETVKSVRKISTDLRPGILDDLGLIPAIEWQCNEFEKKTSIVCKFETVIPEISINKEVSTGVFRIFQESLTNIARHSQASKVKVELHSAENKFSLRITDNGKGFSQDKAGHKTLGLVGMHERAGMLNGQLSINSQPDKGTNVTLTFPRERLYYENSHS